MCDKKITKNLILFTICNTVYDTHPKKNHKMKHKKHTDEREHKDITCAVRLPQSLYSALSETAKITNSSLSDIMRDAITEKLDKIRDQEIARRLKKEQIKAQIEKLGIDPNSRNKGEIDTLLSLMEAS